MGPAIDLLQALPKLLPAAIAWADATSAAALLHGRALDAVEMAIARKVGVRAPERIRIVEANEIPMPEDATLRQAAVAAGLIGPQFVGLTLGYAIFLAAGAHRPGLIAHECRHVAQYESFGSIAAFLSTHLPDVVRVGYWDSALEQDARAFEAQGGM